MDLAAVVLAEMYGLQASATLGGLESETFAFGELRQGGQESTTIFNLVLRAILDLAQQRWQSCSHGVRLPGFGVAQHAIFADNG